MDCWIDSFRGRSVYCCRAVVPLLGKVMVHWRQRLFVALLPKLALQMIEGIRSTYHHHHYHRQKNEGVNTEP